MLSLNSPLLMEDGPQFLALLFNLNLKWIAVLNWLKT
jgi:hypothetical protein